MGGKMKTKIQVTPFLLVLFLSTIAYADNDFGATTQALHDQGFIRQDTGGPLGSGEMALDPFRNADQLNYGGLFGPLEDSSPIPGQVNFFQYGTLQYGARPDTRSLGFEADSDHYMPITPLPRVD
jgi:hypothetical protein